MSKITSSYCSKCTVQACFPFIRADEQPDINKAPNYCPMKRMPEVIDKAISEYNNTGVKDFARQASLQEAECYEHLPDGDRPKNPRILELIQFAQKNGYKKLGLAFCGGLKNEASILTDILEENCFEVVSVNCKVGAAPKSHIGIKPEEKILGPDRWETMCNPIAQAEVLNAEGVDLAVMLGLCIGHDTLFIKYCKVPMTVIAVKDRVTGHNPLAVLYTSNSYYRRIRKYTTARSGEKDYTTTQCSFGGSKLICAHNHPAIAVSHFNISANPYERGNKEW